MKSAIIGSSYLENFTPPNNRPRKGFLMFTPYQRFQQWLAQYSPLVWKSDYQRLEKRLGEIMQQLDAASGARRELEAQLARTRLEGSTQAGHQDFVRDELRQRLEAMEVTISQQTAQIARQEEENVRLKSLTVTDALTGILNRHGLMEFATRAINQRCHELKPGAVKQKEATVTAVYFDLDRFSEANDSHGHFFGDEVLRVVAGHARKHLGHRMSDIVARIGGDEFVIIMIDCGHLKAQTQAEAFRRAVAEDVRLHFIVGELGITVSVGIGCQNLEWNTQADQFLNSLITQADQAMYAAKRTGKNRVCVAPDVTL